VGRRLRDIIFETRSNPRRYSYEYFIGREYGSSVSEINIVLSCLERQVKQRINFNKATETFEFDILLSFYLIKKADVAEKKKIIKREIIEAIKKTFEKFNFEDFDKSSFTSDFEDIVNIITGN
jgi:hypothetical protein